MNARIGHAFSHAFSHARPGLGLILFVAMEASWIGALALTAEMMAAGAAHGYGLAALGFYPFGWLVLRLLEGGEVGERIAAAALAGAFLFALLVLIAVTPADRPERLAAFPDWLRTSAEAHRLVVLVVIAAFCFWRGALLARRGVDGPGVALGFQMGLIVLFLLFLAVAGIDRAVPGGIAFAAAFVICGLLALWAVRRARGGAGSASPAAAITAMAGVLVVAGGLAAIADPRVTEAFLAILAWLGGLIASLLDALFPPPSPQDFPDALMAPQGAAEAPRQRLDLTMPAWVRTLFAFFFFASMTYLVAMALMANLRALTNWLKGFSRTRDLAYDRSTIRFEGLRAFLAMLAGAARAVAANFRARIARWRARRREPFGARRAYRQLLGRLAGRGWPRRASETPRGYAARLKPHWRGAASDLDLLTRAYETERYGRKPVTPLREARLRIFWRKLRRSADALPYRQQEQR